MCVAAQKKKERKKNIQRQIDWMEEGDFYLVRVLNQLLEEQKENDSKRFLDLPRR